MPLKEYKAWDKGTRVFHWLNVICVLGLGVLGTVILNSSGLGMSNDGKIALKTIHVWFGYVFALNLCWRLIWAFFGNARVRWSAILPIKSGGLRGVVAYWKGFWSGQAPGYIGHSPLGRIAVTVILTMLTVQAATGLVLAGTDVYMPPFGALIKEWVVAEGLSASEVKPYAPETVNPEAYAQMRAIRSPVVEIHELMFYALLAMIVLHIAAVVLTDIRERSNIISSMFTGRKTFSDLPADAEEEDFLHK